MKKLIVLMFLFFNIFVIAQESEEGDEFSVDDLPEQKDIFEGKTSIEKPTKLRDPFESPEQTKKKQVDLSRRSFSPITRSCLIYLS